MIRSVPHAFSGRPWRRPLPFVVLLALLLIPLAAGQDAPAPPADPPATEEEAPAQDGATRPDARFGETDGPAGADADDADEGDAEDDPAPPAEAEDAGAAEEGDATGNEEPVAPAPEGAPDLVDPDLVEPETDGAPDAEPTEDAGAAEAADDAAETSADETPEDAAADGAVEDAAPGAPDEGTEGDVEGTDGESTDDEEADADEGDAEASESETAPGEDASTEAGTEAEADAGGEATPAAVVDAEARELRYAPDGELRWTLPLPAEGGPASNAVEREDAVLVAHGLYLLEADRETGTIRARRPLPAPALELTPTEGDGLRARLDLASGAEATIPAGADAESPVRFDADPEAFGWLEEGADAVEDPEAAAERDPTNPWLALATARATEDEEAREARLDAAVDAAGELPFFETARLALALDAAGAPERADAMMDAALRDFAERDYDPRLLTDPELREAYGFPGVAMREAVREGDLATARRLAPHAWRVAAEEAPETVDGLREFAAALRDAGERDAADLWTRRAAELQRAGLSTWLDAGAVALGRFGLLAPVALLGAFVLAWLVLLAKVWRAQSLVRRQRRERDEPARPWARLWVPRHASTTEKISLLAILLLAGFATALAAWGDRTEDVPPALRSGTLASLPAREALATLPDTDWAEVARGVSLHVRGETEAAEAAYVAAGERAPALANLGLLTGDEALLQAALRVDPRDEVARYHLDRTTDPSPFHQAYGGDAPLLAVPSPLEFALASAGDWRESLRATALAPWEALPDAKPAGLPMWGWWLVLGAYALLLALLLLWIFVPRPRASRLAPRTWPYHPLALLVPGTGHLDELWGLLLLVPWAPLALDAVLQWRTGEGALGIPLRTELWILGAIHLANLVGFVVETLSYRRRMRLLREEKPELARSYGLSTRRPVARGDA